MQNGVGNAKEWCPRSEGWPISWVMAFLSDGEKFWVKKLTLPPLFKLIHAGGCSPRRANPVHFFFAKFFAKKLRVPFGSALAYLKSLG